MDCRQVSRITPRLPTAISRTIGLPVTNVMDLLAAHGAAAGRVPDPLGFSLSQAASLISSIS